MVLTVPCSKTYQYGLRGHQPGRLFTAILNRVVTGDPLSGEAITVLLCRHSEAAGYATDRITAHSLRAGHATAAAIAGVALDRIAAQTRHQTASRPSSSATSHLLKPWNTPTAETSDYDRPSGRMGMRDCCTDR